MNRSPRRSQRAVLGGLAVAPLVVFALAACTPNASSSPTAAPSSPSAEKPTVQSPTSQSPTSPSKEPDAGEKAAADQYVTDYNNLATCLTKAGYHVAQVKPGGNAPALGLSVDDDGKPIAKKAYDGCLAEADIQIIQ